MNDRKIAFIACVNDEQEFAEALFYMERLIVPEGYETDVIAVREAPSMAAGYNAAMKSSDAKYKVYLHQDTFIIHMNFIADMLRVFASDSQIGMLGCVGCEELPLNAHGVIAWDTGKVYHNCTPRKMMGRQHEDGKPSLVEALDGLLLATQYDLEWREELFDGWDYYDVSQCFEMIRVGYKVVVPYQEEPWCYHDNSYSKMRNYYKYCRRFIEKYCDIKPFSMMGQSDENAEYHMLREQSRKELMQLVQKGARRELLEIFDVPSNCGYLHLKEFEVLAAIERLEQENGSEAFWQNGDTWEELRRKISQIKFALKRMEYDTDKDGVMLQRVLEKYSVFAVNVVNQFYCESKEKAKAMLYDYSNTSWAKAEKMKEFKNRVRQKYPVPQTEKVQIGDFTYGAPFIATDGSTAKAVIGKFCSFSKGVMLLLEEDHRTDWNSTYPFNVWLEDFSYIKGHPTSKGDIVIGNDVWLAANTTILSGVTIGDGAVIATHSVVTKSVPPYSVVAGNPGRVVKMRFDEETIRRLLEMKWWDWSYEDIYNVIPLLQSEQIDALYDYYLKHVKGKEK